MRNRSFLRFAYLMSGFNLLFVACLAALSTLIPLQASADTVRVTNTNDSGPGSLRQAVADAMPGDEIVFFDVGTGTIMLTSGPIQIDKTLTINGPIIIDLLGERRLNISGSMMSGVFVISSETEVIISDFIIIEGIAELGGGIANFGGNLTLERVLIAGCRAQSGGGIWNSGLLNMIGSSLLDNSADNNGGGILNLGSLMTTGINVINRNSAGQLGGGVYNNGTVENTGLSLEISDNNADDSGGGFFNDMNGALTSTTVIVFDRNSATSGGGLANNIGGFIRISGRGSFTNNSAVTGAAIGNSVGGSVNLENVQISANEATGFGGGFGNDGELEITDSTIEDNTAANGGGGFTGESGELSIRSSVFENNSADESVGGLLHLGAELNIEDTVFTGNSAEMDCGGMAIDGLSPELKNLLIYKNTALNGGGICVNVDVNITNSTITDNTAGVDGGGILQNGGLLRLNLVTLRYNRSSDNTGGGIFSTSTVELKNSIIANSESGGDCGGGGDFVSLGNNIDSDGTCLDGSVASDMPSTDPMLGPLEDNGGPTMTLALLPGSPAIDAVPPEECTDQDGVLVTIDQRGVERPQGPACDIGAFELIVSALKSGGGGCSVAPIGASASLPLYALLPVFFILRRVWKRLVRK